MSLVAENGDILFQVLDGSGSVEVGKMPELRITKSEILFSNVDSFRVIDPVNDFSLCFSLKKPPSKISLLDLISDATCVSNRSYLIIVSIIHRILLYC